MRRVMPLSMLALFLATGMAAQAEPNKVVFPADLDQLVHYATVRRGASTEHILTTEAAITAMKASRQVPDGTRFVLVDNRQGAPYRIFVMQKGAGFGAEYDERRRTADWQFQWFWPDKTINLQENTARCQSCHQPQAQNEYIFTSRQLKSFNGQPVE